MKEGGERLMGRGIRERERVGGGCHIRIYTLPNGFLAETQRMREREEAERVYRLRRGRRVNNYGDNVSENVRGGGEGVGRR